MPHSRAKRKPRRRVATGSDPSAGLRAIDERKTQKDKEVERVGRFDLKRQRELNKANIPFQVEGTGLGEDVSTALAAVPIVGKFGKVAKGIKGTAISIAASEARGEAREAAFKAPLKGGFKKMEQRILREVREGKARAAARLALAESQKALSNLAKIPSNTWKKIGGKGLPPETVDSSQVLKSVFNPKSRDLVTKSIINRGKVFAKSVAGLTFLSTWFFSVIWGKDDKLDAVKTLTIERGKAVSSGNKEAFDEFGKLLEDIRNPNILETILIWSPFAKLEGMRQFGKTAIQVSNIQTRIMNDELVARENGETEDEKWARVEADRITAREADQADRNAHFAEVELRKKEAAADVRSLELEQREEDTRFFEGIAADKIEAAKTERDLYLKQRKEDVEFWDEVFAGRRLADAQARQAEADFWNAYWKQVQTERADTAPSNLKFGLL